MSGPIDRGSPPPLPPFPEELRNKAPQQRRADPSVLKSLSEAGVTATRNLFYSKKHSIEPRHKPPIGVAGQTATLRPASSNSPNFAVLKETLSPSAPTKLEDHPNKNALIQKMQDYSHVCNKGYGMLEHVDQLISGNWKALRAGKDSKENQAVADTSNIVKSAKAAKLAGNSNSDAEIPPLIRQKFFELENTLTALGFTYEKSEGITKGDEGYYHKESSTRLAVMYNKERNEISIFFPGIEGPGSEGFFTRLKQMTLEALGGKPKSTEMCLELGKFLSTQQEDQSVKFSVVGHSHGGNFAQIVALRAGIEGVCFNSRCVSARTVNEIVKDGGKAEPSKDTPITHFSKQGDWLTGTRALNALIAIRAKLTGSISRRVGEEIIVPPHESIKGPLKTFKLHNDIMVPKSLLAKAEKEENDAWLKKFLETNEKY